MVITLLVPSLSQQHYVAANPLSWDQFEIGAAAALTENVSMPLANVNVTISSVKHNQTIGVAPVFNHMITMNSRFDIISTDTQNCCIAFAYPDTWGYGHQDIMYPKFGINFDNMLMPYSVINGSDLTLPNIQTEYLDYVRLAVIEVNLEANTTHILRVSTQMQITLDQNLLRFKYCVGSAKAWEGETHETVRVEIANPDLFERISFYPNDSLSITESLDSILGTWALLNSHHLRRTSLPAIASRVSGPMEAPQPTMD